MEDVDRLTTRSRESKVSAATKVISIKHVRALAMRPEKELWSLRNSGEKK